MISPSEFAAQWKGELVRPRPEAVQPLRIPEESKRFLIETGLPKQVKRRVGFEFPNGTVPTLPEALQAKGQAAPPELNRYRRLGGGVGVHYCADEEAQGKIFAVSLRDKISASFYNASVPQLAESLLAYARLLSQLYPEDRNQRPPAAERARLIAQFRADLERIDPEAMSDRNHVWVITVEELEHGML